MRRPLSREFFNSIRHEPSFAAMPLMVREWTLRRIEPHFWMKAMTRNHKDDSGAKYALGHSEEELDRLKEQARLIDPITQRFFDQAGVGPGMRVLDVGCGAGDTSVLVAKMVGERGEVVGVDRAPAAIGAAQAKGKGRRNLRFLEGDPADMTFEQPFDAVVGRYVLMSKASFDDVAPSGSPPATRRSAGLSRT